jgi:hypothetical protein
MIYLTQMASDQIIPCPYRFLGVTKGFFCFLATIWPLYDVLCSKTDGEREEKVNVKSVRLVAGKIGKKLETAPGYSGRMETTVLLGDPEALDAEMIQEDGAAAKSEAERSRPESPCLRTGRA